LYRLCFKYLSALIASDYANCLKCDFRQHATHDIKIVTCCRHTSMKITHNLHYKQSNRMNENYGEKMKLENDDEVR